MRPRRKRVAGSVPRSAARGGYSLMEAMVAIALFTIIAVVLLPVLFTASSIERLDQADATLKEITDAIAAFHADVDRWPSSMPQLVSAIAAGDRDLCDAAYGGRRTQWDGPYLRRALPADGLPVGIGTAQHEFAFMAGTTIDYLRVVVTGVEPGDAIALDDMIDGDGGQTTGTVQWSDPVGVVVTLYWTIPITKC